MKKITALILFLLFVISMSACTEGSMPNEGNKNNPSKEKSNFDVYLGVDKSLLKMERTVEMPLYIAKAAIGEKRYMDIYRDDKENEYIYRSGTDFLVGYLDSCYEYGKRFEEADMVTEKEIEQASKEYLERIAPGVKNYTLDREHSGYGEREMIFCMQYIYCVNGIQTDDMMAIYFLGDGTFGGYSAYRQGLYNDIELTSKQKNTIDKDTGAAKFLSLNNGKLYLASETVNDAGAGSQKVTELK